MSYIKFSDLLAEMQETFNRKNKDYGNSFDKQMEEFGMLEPLILLSIKLDRLKSLTFSNTIAFIAIRLLSAKKLDNPGDVKRRDDAIAAIRDFLVTKNEVIDESVADTLKDMGNYAVMTAVHEMNKSGQED